jgi:uncharacterized membrane protein YuzA (DUF378 family)
MCNGKCGGCIVHRTCGVLLIIGGLNWGLVGLGMLMGSDLNVVHMIFGSMPTLEAIVYLLVGVAAVMKIFGCKCKKCMEACATCQAGSMDKPM